MINLWQFSRAESQNEICAKWLPTEAKKTWLILSGTQICNNQIRKTSNKQRETTQKEREHCARGMQRTETKTWKNIRRKQQAATTTSTEATKRRIIYHNEDVRQRPRQHLQKAQIQRYKTADTRKKPREERRRAEKRGEENKGQTARATKLWSKAQKHVKC